MAVATPSAFGIRLRELRVRAGISQYELGKRAGVLPSTINRLEGGVREPSWIMVRRLAKVLGVSVTAFETPEDEPTVVTPPPASQPRPMGKRK